ncbi:hexokinase protein HXK2 [Corchorus olitorius]|uniref:Hexokinase protein HXK2 n=1 Tax=Corchorus olitorius TaxID=93759 RepID=A0A1R3JV64_9ROSI|nr:hexokinase protein HXK2 [Corchorus olitorius]
MKGKIEREAYGSRETDRQSKTPARRTVKLGDSHGRRCRPPSIHQLSAIDRWGFRFQPKTPDFPLNLPFSIFFSTRLQRNYCDSSEDLTMVNYHIMRQTNRG